MDLASRDNGGVMDPVIEHPHTYETPSALVTGWIIRGASKLRALFEHVTCAWSHRMINIFWQEFVRGRGIGKPPNSALYGVDDSPQLCRGEWSQRRSTVVASPLVH